ncbi:MAG: hypothetical protein KAV82_03830 [Phycisphaerae bacterium]|nr:hypothetical protein [Phycisphaerae bacterium]
MPTHYRGKVQSGKIPARLGAMACGLLACGLGLTTAGCGTPFRSEENLTLTTPVPARKLVVHNRFGDVVVQADPAADAVRAEITKTGRGATVGAARAALTQIEVSLAPKEGEPGTVIASTRHPGGNNLRSYAVEWHIVAPPDLLLEVSSGFGDVEAYDFKSGLVLKSAFGDIRAKAGGEIELRTDFGDVDLELLADNPDDVRVCTDFGDVLVRVPSGRQGRFVAQTDFGSLSLNLENISTERLRHRGRYFEADFGGAGTPVFDLLTNFGDVIVRSYDATTAVASGAE